MRLRNKKTGEIKDIEIVKKDGNIRSAVDGRPLNNEYYNSLAELNEEWEDYEEPKEHWFISEYGGVFSLNEYKGLNNVANPEDYKEIGNYFETNEEAEKAVEKLKAWKRLKDIGFEFDGWHPDAGISFCLWNTDLEKESVCADLDLLFGGEE